MNPMNRAATTLRTLEPWPRFLTSPTPLMGRGAAFAWSIFQPPKTKKPASGLGTMRSGRTSRASSERRTVLGPD